MQRSNCNNYADTHKTQGSRIHFLKATVWFLSYFLLRFLLKIVCRSETVIAKLKQERIICVWSKPLQDKWKKLVRVWESQCGGSTCSKTQHANWFFSESEMCFDSKSRQKRGIERKKGSGRNMNNLKWNWGGNSTESYNVIYSSCSICFVIAVSFEPSLICPSSMTPSTRLHRGGNKQAK